MPKGFEQYYSKFELQVGFINMQLSSIGKPTLHLEEDGGKYFIHSTTWNKKKKMTEQTMRIYLDGFCDALTIVTYEGK